MYLCVYLKISETSVFYISSEKGVKDRQKERDWNVRERKVDEKERQREKEREERKREKEKHKIMKTAFAI